MKLQLKKGLKKGYFLILIISISQMVRNSNMKFGVHVHY